jgi:hypothetical protein
MRFILYYTNSLLKFVQFTHKTRSLARDVIFYNFHPFIERFGKIYRTVRYGSYGATVQYTVQYRSNKSADAHSKK